MALNKEPLLPEKTIEEEIDASRDLQDCLPGDWGTALPTALIVFSAAPISRSKTLS
jgi:hypothetical protein